MKLINLCLVSLFAFSVPLQANTISLDDLYNYQIEKSQLRADRLEKLSANYDRKAKLVESRCNANIKLSWESKVKLSDKFFTNPDKIYISKFRKGAKYCEVHIVYSSGVCITRAENIIENAVSLGPYIHCEN